MDKTEQKKDQPAPVISPLASDKTYGERIYSRIFDWGLNYWTNLLASAGFSQWAEHGTKPVLGASPRQHQQSLAGWIRKHDPIMKGFVKEMNAAAASGLKTEAQAAEAIFDRSMARARSLTLLIPGFVVMIPAVWLGAKIKPWLVEKLNKWHYGEEALDDPTLKARHQAIAAEERPTLLGTTIARFLTVGAVQIVSQGFGSKDNRVNKWGEKHNNETMKNFGIDPFTEKVGTALGGAAPEAMRNSYNRFATKHGLAPSDKQLKDFAKEAGMAWSTDYSSPAYRAVVAAKGAYQTATQDLGRFVIADTVYTLVTALTIRPFVKLLRHIPGMSFKPKVAADSATFDGDKIKVPSNPFTDTTPAPDSLNRAEGNGTPKVSNRPEARVNTVREQGTLTDRTLEVTA